MATIDITNTSGSTSLISLSTTAILATYVSSTALYCGAGDQTFYLTATRNATIADVTFRAQISDDGTNWMDVATTRADTASVAAEHVVALAAGANRVAFVCTLAKRSKAMRVSVKADVQGGAGESVTVTGVAW